MPHYLYFRGSFIAHSHFRESPLCFFWPVRRGRGFGFLERFVSRTNMYDPFVRVPTSFLRC